MTGSHDVLLNEKIMLAKPRYVDAGPLLFVGLRQDLDENSEEAIPALWQRFINFTSQICHRADGAGYGLCMQLSSQEHTYYYMASCTVTDFSSVPPELSQVILPSQRYAVFTHDNHVTRIKETIDAIFAEWLPNSGHALADKSDQLLHFLERYDEAFDEHSGLGGMEIWVPIAEDC